MYTNLWRLLAQLGGTTPTFEGGPGGPSPVPVAPGQEYPAGGGNLPANPWDYWAYPGDFGFQMHPGPGGAYTRPIDPFWRGNGWAQLGLYTPPAQPTPWETAGSPLGLGRRTPIGNQYSVPQGSVWGVPLVSPALLEHWLDLASRGLAGEGLAQF
jgi:hypothetical protein